MSFSDPPLKKPVFDLEDQLLSGSDLYGLVIGGEPAGQPEPEPENPDPEPTVEDESESTD